MANKQAKQLMIEKMQMKTLMIHYFTPITVGEHLEE